MLVKTNPKGNLKSLKVLEFSKTNILKIMPLVQISDHRNLVPIALDDLELYNDRQKLRYFTKMN